MMVKTENLEYRGLNDIKTIDDENLVIEGVVNNVGEFSKVLGGTFREKIEPGVFTRALDKSLKNRDIFFLHQHDERALPLASIKSGTLELSENIDDNKLTMRATLPNTQFSRDVYELVKTGVLREFSFGFSNPKSKWTRGDDGIKERTLTDFDIHEISIVRTGAYNNTQAFARAINEIDKEIENQEKYISNKLKIIKNMDY